MMLSTTEATLQAWVAIFGRLHPLLVHAPIGLLIAVALLRASQAWRNRRANAADRNSSSRAGVEVAIGFLCWVAAFAALLTATAGLVLAQEAEYTAAPALDRHRLLGLIGAGAALLVALTHGRAKLAVAHHALLAFTLVLIGVAGHAGAELTHGPGFLTEPLRSRAARAPEPAPSGAPQTPAAQAPAVPASTSDAPTAAAVSSTTAVVSYRHEIAPIFAAYCVSCHGEAKRKGGLALHTPEWIRHGGGSGAVLATAQASQSAQSPQSELLRRALLPEDDDDAMPPAGRARPSAAELALLQKWIEAGAPFDDEGAAPSTPTPPGNVQAESRAPSAVAASDVTASAVAANAAATTPEAAIDALRAHFVHVQRRVPDSPLLWIDTAAVAEGLDDARALAWLAPLATQVADLSLARSKVTDAIAPLLVQLENVERLDLSATKIGAPTLRALAALPKLRELVLTRTQLGACTLEDLLALEHVQKLRVWNSGIADGVLRELAARRPQLRIDDGSGLRSKALETESVVELTSPAVGESAAEAARTTVAVGAGKPAAAEPVNKLCPVSGMPIKAGFTREYKGKLVGFCCPNCPKEFDANPEAFASKLE